MKPTGEFFRELGQYVYAYIDPTTDEWLYTGKGNGDRCWHHVDDKEYDSEWCHIVARNLEKFNKKDWQSLCLESFLIELYQPRDNKVSGHYKDCFIMKSLSLLFQEHVEDRRDMFKELVNFIESNKKDFPNERIRTTESRKSSFLIESPAKINTQIGLRFNLNDETFRMMIKSNSGGEHFTWLTEKVKDILEDEREITETKDTVSFAAESQEEALSLWREFHS